MVGFSERLQTPFPSAKGQDKTRDFDASDGGSLGSHLRTDSSERGIRVIFNIFPSWAWSNKI
jgi:hypothetical protein